MESSPGSQHRERVSLHRDRRFAFFAIIAGAAGVLLVIVFGVAEGRPLAGWLPGVLCLSLVALNVSPFVKAQRSLRAFDEQHSSDAGMQTDGTQF